MDTLVKRQTRAARLVDLLALTKPRQTALLLVTGVCTYTLSRGLPFDPIEGLAMVVGLLGAIGGCTALNMVLDQDIDGVMTRTASRPLPSGSVRRVEAVIFGALLSGLGLVLSFAVDVAFGWVVASGFVIDLLIYTAWLKRRTALSILFGGISGGMPVLAGRVLALGSVDGIGILLTSSIVLWIPSHILTLAIRYADDYERAGVPTWPNIYGSQPTRLVIATANLLNTLVLTGAGLLLQINRAALVLLVGISIGMFVLSAWQLIAPTARRNWMLFKAASLYMLAASLLVTLGTVL